MYYIIDLSAMEVISHSGREPYPSIEEAEEDRTTYIEELLTDDPDLIAEEVQREVFVVTAA